MAIRQIAALQDSRVARAQLLAAGVADAAIRRRLRSGALVRRHPGVYVIGGAGETGDSPEIEALLAAGPLALLGLHSAVIRWRFRPGRARPVRLILPARMRGPRLAWATVHRTGLLLPGDRTVIDGLPVTSAARTVLDVSATPLSDRDVERLLTEAIHVRRATSRAELERLCARCRAHPGRARLERVLRRADGQSRTDSPPEETLLALIRRARLPEPRSQAWVLDYKLDLFWPEHRFGVEVDAYGTHGFRRRFERDRARDSDLLARAGVVVIRPTDERIAREPIAVVAEIAAALARLEQARVGGGAVG